MPSTNYDTYPKKKLRYLSKYVFEKIKNKEQTYFVENCNALSYIYIRMSLSHTWCNFKQYYITQYFLIECEF